MSALANELNKQIKERNNTTTTQSTSQSITSTTVPIDFTTSEDVSTSTSNYTEPIVFVRSRNISFDVKGLKPSTRFYPTFAGVDISKFIIPKLLEIQMVSGVFQVGETVESDITNVSSFIRFRICPPNHKDGPFINDTPTSVYVLNPYTNQNLSNTYSNSSNVLNIDVQSLQLPTETDFYGFLSSNVRLIGKTSNAVATVSNIRLVSDSNGRLSGSLFIPDPNKIGNPKFISGLNLFTLSDVDSPFTNSTSFAKSEYSSSGITNVTETNIVTTRTITITPPYDANVTTVSNITTNATTKVRITDSQIRQLQTQLEQKTSDLASLQIKTNKTQRDLEKIKSLTEEIEIINNVLKNK